MHRFSCVNLWLLLKVLGWGMLKSAAAPEPASAPNPRLVESVESPPEKPEEPEKKSETSNLPASIIKPNPPPSGELGGEEGGPGPPLSLAKPPPAAKRMGGWARLKGPSAPRPPAPPAPSPAPLPAPSTAPALAPSPAHELPFSLAAAPCPGGWDKLKDESSSTPETPAAAPATQPAPGGWGAPLRGSDTPTEGRLLPSTDAADTGCRPAMQTAPSKSAGGGEQLGQAAPLASIAESSELLSNLAQFKVCILNAMYPYHLEIVIFRLI